MELCEGNGGKVEKEPGQKARGRGLKQDQGGIGVYTDDSRRFKVLDSPALWLSSLEYMTYSLNVVYLPSDLYLTVGFKQNRPIILKLGVGGVLVRT